MGGGTPKEPGADSPKNAPARWGWAALIGIDIVLGITLLWLLHPIVKYYSPPTRKFQTAAGNALLRLKASFLPGQREHLFEAMERDDSGRDEQGDPPQTGKSEDLRSSHELPTLAAVSSAWLSICEHHCVSS